MFLIKFIGLTLAYLSGGAIIAWLIAKARSKDPWVFLANGGVWFWVLAGITLVTFVIALFNWGHHFFFPRISLHRNNVER